jgi:hypothetical protein
VVTLRGDEARAPAQQRLLGGQHGELCALANARFLAHARVAWGTRILLGASAETPRVPAMISRSECLFSATLAQLAARTASATSPDALTWVSGGSIVVDFTGLA